jgi:hypothetical protein
MTAPMTSALALAAQVARDQITRPGPRPTIDAVVCVMALVADDVASYSQTGRTMEQTVADARACIYAAFDAIAP